MTGGGLAGTTHLVRIALRTGWGVVAAWIAGLLLLFVLTVASVATLYGTPADLAVYSASVGDSMVMLTGRVAGPDTLGGVVMTEYSYMVTFGVPLMAIALTTRFTRREEESGRTELLLAAGPGRLAPLAAGLVVVVAAFLALGAGLWAVTLPTDIDPSGAALYAASVAAAGWVYAAGTAVVSQCAAHTRTVWAVSTALAGLTLLTRGVGDTRQNLLSWTSPLGWHGLTRPFGDPTPAPLLLAVAVALLLSTVALRLHAHRDLGAGLIPSRPGPVRAPRWRTSPTGAAVHHHLGPLVGWAIGAAALMGLYGGLMQVVLEAVEATPSLEVFLGGTGTLLDTIVQLLVAFAGILGAGYALQAASGLRTEETSGRLELQLAAGRPRGAWLATHAAVVTAGAVIVVGVGVVIFAATTAAVLDEPAQFGRIIAAGLWQIPAATVFAAGSVALFGLAPRLQALIWAVFVAGVVVTLMGPTLQLTGPQLRLSPFGAVGNAPAGPVDATGVTVLLAATALLTLTGLLAFRRRDVPRT